MVRVDLGFLAESLLGGDKAWDHRWLLCLSVRSIAISCPLLRILLSKDNIAFFRSGVNHEKEAMTG